MKKSTNILFIACWLVVSVLASGCEKFLDADQPLQVREDEVFSTEKGFEEAINGVYLQMGTSALYGRDLSYGLLSVLGRSYDTTITPAIGALYYEGARYNFANNAVKNAIKLIWDSSYQCIANLNHLLEIAPSRKGIFTGDKFNLVTGEAYALRAFLHFDLVRMFGPADARNNLTVPAIPYVTRVSPYPVPTLTTAAAIDSCISDLKKAEALITEKTKKHGHLRYWGIRALLARIYLYKGDLANARSYAQDVITNGGYLQATGNSDYSFTSEHVFNLVVYLGQLGTMTKGVFNISTPLGLLPANQNALYVTGSGATTDWRRSGAFIDPLTGSTSNSSNPNAVIMPRKFNNPANNVLPMIRLSEMYYIVAECAAATGENQVATERLNSVRASRNLPAYGLPALSTDSLRAEIAMEYQKEMLGDGQVFYFYKRNNLPFASLPFTKVPVVANASYVFPKPE